MPERWDGPFDESLVFNFLARMREGATVQIFRTVRTSDTEDPQLLGWFQKQTNARFVAGTPSLGQRFSVEPVKLRDAVREFAAMDPEYVLHDAQWSPMNRPDPVRSVTPELREMVRKVVEDPASGGLKSLERRKRDHWIGSLNSYGLAESALLALGYNDTPREILDELAPTVEEAFEVFKEKRPDLEPW